MADVLSKIYKQSYHFKEGNWQYVFPMMEFGFSCKKREKVLENVSTTSLTLFK